jgi:hypothetical protein
MWNLDYFGIPAHLQFMMKLILQNWFRIEISHIKPDSFKSNFIRQLVIFACVYEHKTIYLWIAGIIFNGMLKVMEL